MGVDTRPQRSGRTVQQVILRQGQAVIEDVPVPVVEPGTLLVRVRSSCISVGTEMSGVRHGSTPLWRRAMRRPGAVVKVLEMAATQGLSRTRSLVAGKLAAGQPTGYSAAGTVVEVGAGVDRFHVGDRVACAGAQCAHHAEFIRPPENLTVPVPDALDWGPASTVTLGAIALQGVRRAAPTMGESFVVLGLGLLGQLVSQLLKVHGCRVIGCDLDPNRVALAKQLGMDAGLNPEVDSDVQHVQRLTDGFGVDGVIITAATASDAVASTAFQMCRKKGRVVLVGDVGLNLNRHDIYEKELDFLVSTSYGPGRYDRRYEEEGLDYPRSYVRWTENRNLAEYLRLLGERRLDVLPLIAAEYPISEAPQAYEVLKAPGEQRPLMIVLNYGDDADCQERVTLNPTACSGPSGRLRLALVGAGSFAKGMHLPNLQSLGAHYDVRTIVSRSGHNAAAVARQCGARSATTDYQSVLDDSEIDAVLITTRHNLHADQTLQALQAGKHVLVEKPLVLHTEELDAIESFYQAPGDKPLLLTGFNRRFSQHARRLKKLVDSRSNPMILNYRMNAGYLPLDTWYHTPEGGGRNLGEACHIYDLFVYLTGSRAVAVSADAIRPGTGHYSSSDNFVATIRFEDGSLATLTYTALGSPSRAKELLDVYVDGRVLELNDYRDLCVHGSKARGLKTRSVEKGHLQELVEFAETIADGGDWPIPLWQQVQATRIALEVERKLSACGASDPGAEPVALRRAS
jgi:predicted dehydrogenase/threonine dehydrogenase-like Zn-dependent dehydrogenase